MLEPESEPVTEESSLSHDLLHLYDEVTEFNDYCAFLCDAFACLAVEEDCMDASTAQGLSQLSHWMKRRMEALKLKLKKIQEKSHIQAKLTKS